MADILSNISLQAYNTFGIDVSAKLFGQFTSVEELDSILSNDTFKNEELLILGGGSNVLFTKDQDSLVLLNQIGGIKIEQETEQDVVVSSGGGVVWHEFVLHCIKEHWCGIENLSLIPGSVGASPMQNIGAYGVEIKDVFEWLEAYHISSGEIHRFHHSECEFGYRESVFKRTKKGQYIITRVAFKLSKAPNVNTSYGAIEQQLENMNISSPGIKDVSDAVIAIRSSKLPDPAEIGNGGSFFKNPVISNDQFQKLKSKYPNVASYPVGDSQTKIAAGWLIDQAGWKGKTIDNYGVHKNQALVLVNYGGATGKEIFDLSEDIIQSVRDKYGVSLEREVNIY